METLKDALKAIYSSIPTKVTITNLTMNGHCQSCRQGVAFSVLSSHFQRGN